MRSPEHVVPSERDLVTSALDKCAANFTRAEENYKGINPKQLELKGWNFIHTDTGAIISRANIDENTHKSEQIKVRSHHLPPSYNSQEWTVLDVHFGSKENSLVGLELLIIGGGKPTKTNPELRPVVLNAVNGKNVVEFTDAGVYIENAARRNWLEEKMEEFTRYLERDNKVRAYDARYDIELEQIAQRKMDGAASEEDTQINVNLEKEKIWDRAGRTSTILAPWRRLEKLYERARDDWSAAHLKDGAVLPESIDPGPPPPPDLITYDELRKIIDTANGVMCDLSGDIADFDPSLSPLAKKG